MISIELRYKGTAVPIKFFKNPNRFIPGNPSLKKLSTLLRLGFFWKISRLVYAWLKIILATIHYVDVSPMGGMLEDFWANTLVSTGDIGGIRHL